MLREINPGFRLPVGQERVSGRISPASCRASGWWPCASAFRRNSSTASIASSPTSRSRRRRFRRFSITRSRTCRTTSTRVSATARSPWKCRFDARQFLLEKGTSAEYGARELNRTIHRFLTQPLATLVATNQVSPGAACWWRWPTGRDKLNIRSLEAEAVAAPANPTVLLVDDNRDLLHFLERLMADAGWTLLTAESATEAKRLCAQHKPDAALLDYMLPDGNGVELGVEFLQAVPQHAGHRDDRHHPSARRRGALRGAQFPGAAKALPGIRCDEPDPQPPRFRQRHRPRVTADGRRRFPW